MRADGTVAAGSMALAWGRGGGAVGFWGVTVMARSGRDLADLASVKAFGGEVDWEAEGIKGWRLLRLHGTEWPADELVQAAAEDVAGPVLCAYVVDGDFAQVRLAAPGTDRFEFVLNQTSAGNYDYPVDSVAQASAPVRVQAWAGDGSDMDAVAEAVATEMVFAEDVVLRLAAAVGAISPDQVRDWAFGPLEGMD